MNMIKRDPWYCFLVNFIAIMGVIFLFNFILKNGALQFIFLSASFPSVFL
ncbi:MAG: hypothetical protein AAB552_01095 [Patescibacteria group bacterium]